MDINIRSIEEGDLTAVVELMRDFAAYEDLLEYCTVTEDRLSAAMFGDEGYVEGLIALDGPKAIGYALYYPCFSSFGAERGLYLEDLYVDIEYRRHEIGFSLIRRIAASGAGRGLERIDFLVLNWNDPAVTFYLKHGAERNDDDRHFKFAGDAFRALAHGPAVE